MLLKQKMPLDEEEEEQDDKKKKKDKSWESEISALIHK